MIIVEYLPSEETLGFMEEYDQKVGMNWYVTKGSSSNSSEQVADEASRRL